MLNKGTLKRINPRPRKARLILLAGAGAVALGVALLALATSPLIALAAVPVGALWVLAAHRAERERRITTLTYDDLEGDLAAPFSGVWEALEALSSSARMWRVSAAKRAGESGPGKSPPHPSEPRCGWTCCRHPASVRISPSGG